MANSEVTRDFRRVFLPYCLMRLQDGRYVATNRQYKPIGSVSTSWVDYENLPDTGKLTIPAKLIAQLDYRGQAEGDRIYLYRDANIPTRSPANWAEYAARLEILATCSTSP
jgi:hypothetical protein